MKEHNITIYDVAKEANVSMATVSRVVNGNSNVREETKKKVLDVIKRLNYHPNAVARGLASKKTTTVGVIIPDVTSIYFASLARGIDDIASMYKYNIILANSDEGYKEEKHVLNTLLSKQVDGIIYLGRTLSDKIRQSFLSSNTPVILAGSTDKEKKISSVNIDYEKAFEVATTFLIKNGNRDISLVIGDLDKEVNSESCLIGYKKALYKFKIKYNDKLVFQTNYDYTSGLELWNQIKNESTAAVIGNDELAFGILDGALDDKLIIPKDFEIITSDNTKLTQMSRPQLTSIYQPLYDIGAVSMRLLTKIMNKETFNYSSIMLPFSVIKRSSTK